MKTPTIHTAPPNTGEAVLGKTLPELMYDACAQYTNPRALNQPTDGDWLPFSLDEFRQQAEETALGLLDLGVLRGEPHENAGRHPVQGGYRVELGSHGFSPVLRSIDAAERHVVSLREAGPEEPAWIVASLV